MDLIKRYLFGSVFRRGATLLTALTLASYVLGLVRDMVFSRVLGASRLLDVYNAAFIVPDVLLNVFVASALGAAFIPVFSHLLARGEESNAQKLAGTMMAAAPGAMAIISLIALAGMPWIARIVAPGFSGEELALLVHMSRLMLLSPILFALSNTLGNILVSLERFAGYGLSPVLYNVGIIGGAFAVSIVGPLGLVIGTIAGAVLHLSIRIIALARAGWRPRGPIDLANRDFRQVLKLMVPRMAGQPIEQLTFFIFTSFASSLAVGSIAVLNFARNFQSVPVALFGISFATAVFPLLSKKAALGDRVGFTRDLRATALPLAAMTAVSAIVYIAAGRPIIGVLLGGGRFDADQVARTAQLLAFFAFSIPAESFGHLLGRSFYALKDTWTPVIVSVPGLALTWILARLFMPGLGLNALALAYVISATAKSAVLFLLLRRKLRLL